MSVASLRAAIDAQDQMGAINAISELFLTGLSSSQVVPLFPSLSHRDLETATNLLSSKSELVGLLKQRSQTYLFPSKHHPPSCQCKGTPTPYFQMLQKGAKVTAAEFFFLALAAFPQISELHTIRTTKISSDLLVHTGNWRSAYMRILDSWICVLCPLIKGYLGDLEISNRIGTIRGSIWTPRTVADVAFNALAEYTFMRQISPAQRVQQAPAWSSGSLDQGLITSPQSRITVAQASNGTNTCGLVAQVETLSPIGCDTALRLARLVSVDTSQMLARIPHESSAQAFVGQQRPQVLDSVYCCLLPAIAKFLSGVMSTVSGQSATTLDCLTRVLIVLLSGNDKVQIENLRQIDSLRLSALLPILSTYIPTWCSEVLPALVNVAIKGSHSLIERAVMCPDSSPLLANAQQAAGCAATLALPLQRQRIAAARASLVISHRLLGVLFSQQLATSLSNIGPHMADVVRYSSSLCELPDISLTSKGSFLVSINSALIPHMGEINSALSEVTRSSLWRIADSLMALLSVCTNVVPCVGQYVKKQRNSTTYSLATEIQNTVISRGITHGTAVAAMAIDSGEVHPLVESTLSERKVHSDPNQTVMRPLNRNEQSDVANGLLQPSPRLLLCMSPDIGYDMSIYRSDEFRPLAYFGVILSTLLTVALRPLGSALGRDIRCPSLRFIGQWRFILTSIVAAFIILIITAREPEDPLAGMEERN